MQRFHGVATGLEGDAVGRRTVDTLAGELVQWTLRFFSQGVNARVDGHDHQVNVVTVLAQHGTDREQDMFYVIRIGFIELIDQPMFRFAEYIGVQRFRVADTVESEKAGYDSEDAEELSTTDTVIQKLDKICMHLSF